MLENSRKIINTKVENRTNLLSTIYLAHKQVGEGRLSSHIIQGSIHTNYHSILWYNHAMNYPLAIHE